jgi:hypothetical protein
MNQPDESESESESLPDDPTAMSDSESTDEGQFIKTTATVSRLSAVDDLSSLADEAVKEVDPEDIPSAVKADIVNGERP